MATSEEEKYLETIKCTILKSPWMSDEEVQRSIYKAKEYLYEKIGVSFSDENDPIDFKKNYVALFDDLVRYIHNDAMDQFEGNNAQRIATFIFKNRYKYDQKIE